MENKDTIEDNQDFNLDWCSAPGDTILDCLEELQISSTEFYSKIGLKRSEATGLLNGTTIITEIIAESLEMLFKVDKQFWINREKHYRDKLKELNLVK